jgi:hypothetical protein
VENRRPRRLRQTEERGRPRFRAGLASVILSASAGETDLQTINSWLSVPAIGQLELRVFSPTILEVSRVNSKSPDPAAQRFYAVRVAASQRVQREGVPNRSRGGCAPPSG